MSNRRWIRFGGFTLQSSEVAKFEMILLCSSLAAKAPQVEKLSPGKMVIMNFREWLHVRVWKQLVIPVLPLIPAPMTRTCVFKRCCVILPSFEKRPCFVHIGKGAARPPETCSG